MKVYDYYFFINNNNDKENGKGQAIKPKGRDNVGGIVYI